MNNRIEYKGYWHLPATPELEVAGVLIYYPDEKIELELIGSFDEDIDDFIVNNVESVIYGKTSDAKNISLIQCSRSNNSLNFSAGFPITKYNCRYMIIGKHITSLDDKSRYFANFTIPELSVWCCPNSIKYSYKLNNKTRNITDINISFNVAYRNHSAIVNTVNVNENTSIVLRNSVDYKEYDMRTIKYIKQFVSVDVLKHDESSVFDIMSDIHQFEDFISLATLRNVKSSHITLFDENMYQETSNNRIFDPIYVIYVSREINSITNSSRNDYLFNYEDIKDQYSDLLKAWFNASVDLLPIRKHLIESLRKKKIYSSVDFLTIMQAVEGFWWRFREEDYKKKHNLNRDTKLKVIINELINEFSEVSLLLDCKIDVDSVVDSRHYYSHFMPRDKKPKSLDGIPLLKECRKMRVLLICCFLFFMGMKKSDINILLNKCRKNLLL